MKQGIRTSIDWALIGAELANSDAAAQIDFLKAFVRECQSWGTNHQVEMQLAAVNRELTDSEKYTLSMLSYREDQ